MIPSRRPLFSTLVTPSTNFIPCRNARQIVLNYHIWHDASRITQHGRSGAVCIVLGRGTGGSRRYASSSTSTAETTKGRSIPPLPTKPSKTTLPAKPKTIQPPMKAAQSASRIPTRPPATTPAPYRPPTALASNTPNSKLNPPDFTYAPELNVPARQEGQNYFKWLWAAGRAYMTFYKTGASNVRQTAKLAKELRRKVEAQGKNTERHNILTRAETQIIRRSRRDMYRLPFFGLILLVFGEWTPLLVMYLTPVIPEPCRIPKQVEKTERKEEKKRHAMMETLQAQMQRNIAASNTAQRQMVTDSTSLRAADTGSMPLFAAMHFAVRFGRGVSVLSGMAPGVFLRPGVRKTLEYLKMDDELVARDGGWRALNSREMRRVARERGIDVVGKSEEDIRKGVAGWFGAR